MNFRTPIPEIFFLAQTLLDSAQETLIKVPREERREEGSPAANGTDGSQMRLGASQRRRQRERERERRGRIWYSGSRSLCLQM